MNSKEMLKQAMTLLASQPNALFIGQNVRYSGTVMYETLEHIPESQRIEHPITEETTVGFATGLAMMGHLPVVVIPRIDFLLRAMDQLVNHLDKIAVMSRGQWQPKVIIRTRVGGKVPLDAGPQHTQRHVIPLRIMLTKVMVVEITKPEQILPAYEVVIAQPDSAIIVENLG